MTSPAGEPQRMPERCSSRRERRNGSQLAGNVGGVTSIHKDRQGADTLKLLRVVFVFAVVVNQIATFVNRVLVNHQLGAFSFPPAARVPGVCQLLRRLFPVLHFVPSPFCLERHLFYLA